MVFFHRKLHIPTPASNQPISRRNMKKFIAFACKAWVTLLPNDEIQGLRNWDISRLCASHSQDSGRLFCYPFISSIQICQLAFFCEVLNFFSLILIMRGTPVARAVLLSRLRHFKGNACFIHHLLLSNLVLMQKVFDVGIPHFSGALPGPRMSANVEVLKM